MMSTFGSTSEGSPTLDGKDRCSVPPRIQLGLEIYMAQSNMLNYLEPLHKHIQFILQL